jgi:hypothetical protein
MDKEDFPEQQSLFPSEVADILAFFPRNKDMHLTMH